MSIPNNSLPHLPDPDAVVRAIGREAMLARLEAARRLGRYRSEKAVVAEVRQIVRSFGLDEAPPARPVARLDGDAFDAALGVFHRVRASALPPAAFRDAEAYDEATREALEAFLGAYTERVDEMVRARRVPHALRRDLGGPA